MCLCVCVYASAANSQPARSAAVQTARLGLWPCGEVARACTCVCVMGWLCWWGRVPIGSMQLGRSLVPGALCTFGTTLSPTHIFLLPLQTYGDSTLRVTVDENIVFVNIPKDKVDAMLAEPLFQKFKVNPGACGVCVTVPACIAQLDVVVWRASHHAIHAA